MGALQPRTNQPKQAAMQDGLLLQLQTHLEEMENAQIVVPTSVAQGRRHQCKRRATVDVLILVRGKQLRAGG